MIRSYIYTIIISSFALILSACHNDVVEVDNDQQLPILFSGSFTSEGVGSSDLKSAGVRAATTLPEGTKIVVVAAKAKAKLPIAGDWTTPDSLYLNHVEGTVGAPTSVHPDPTDEYPITLEKNPSFTHGKWYWPFNPNEYLGFMAYSPIPLEVGGDDRVERKAMDLTVTAGKVDDFLPDLLYTGKLGNYNKTDKKVLLPFKHAMARLAVKVIVVDQDDNILVGQHPVNQIEISSLVIKTKVNEGVFGLSDSKWNSLESTTDYQTAYTLASETSTRPLPYDNSETSVCYLFPSTTTTDVVDLTGIEFKVRDKNTNVVVGDLYPLNSFLQVDEITPVTLDMGKTTLLTIKVKYVSITDPDPDIILQGQLVEWDYKGKSEVVIE